MNVDSSLAKDVRHDAEKVTGEEPEEKNYQDESPIEMSEELKEELEARHKKKIQKMKERTLKRIKERGTMSRHQSSEL